MTSLLTLTNIGLTIDILGALLMFFGAEKVSYTTLIHQDEHYKYLNRLATRKNRMIRTGAVLLLFGFLLQLLANIRL